MVTSLGNIREKCKRKRSVVTSSVTYFKIINVNENVYHVGETIIDRFKIDELIVNVIK